MEEIKKQLDAPLWAKESFSGAPYLSGKIQFNNFKFTDKKNGIIYLSGEIPVVYFQNKKKTGNQPDYRGQESKPKESSVGPAPHPAMTTLKPIKVEEADFDFLDEKVPF